MARFIQEIIDGKLVVSKKKKVVLVQELRDKKYRPFPKGDTNIKKVKNTDEEMDQEDEADEEDAEIDAGVPGANDYDYLLSVSWLPSLLDFDRTNPRSDANLLPDPRAP